MWLVDVIEYTVVSCTWTKTKSKITKKDTYCKMVELILDYEY